LTIIFGVKAKTCQKPVNQQQEKQLLTKENFNSSCPTNNEIDPFNVDVYDPGSGSLSQMFTLSNNAGNLYWYRNDNNPWSLVLWGLSTVNYITDCGGSGDGCDIPNNISSLTVPFMFIWSNQKNGNTLTITNSLPFTVTTCWLASTDHSACINCGTLEVGKEYQFTWDGSDGNYIWVANGEVN